MDDVPVMNHLVPERTSGFPWILLVVGLRSSYPFSPLILGRDLHGKKALAKEHFELSA